MLGPRLWRSNLRKIMIVSFNNDNTTSHEVYHQGTVNVHTLRSGHDAEWIVRDIKRRLNTQLRARIIIRCRLIGWQMVEGGLFHLAERKGSGRSFAPRRPLAGTLTRLAAHWLAMKQEDFRAKIETERALQAAACDAHLRPRAAS